MPSSASWTDLVPGYLLSRPFPLDTLADWPAAERPGLGARTAVPVMA